MRGVGALCSALLALCCASALLAAEDCVCDDSGNALIGVCEDSGPGSASSDCELGRDCSDCGPSTRSSLQPGVGCGDNGKRFGLGAGWLMAYNCADGVVDPITSVCYCSSPASNAADNCTAVEETCAEPCIEGTEDCCEANAALVRVLGYERQQIAANDPVRGTYMLFTEESELLSDVGTDHPQIEALQDGSIVYAHGDVLEHFSADGTHLGAVPIGVSDVVATCLRRLSAELLLVCDASNSSVLLTHMTAAGESITIESVRKLTLQDGGVDVARDPLDLAFTYDSESDNYAVYLLARDDTTEDRAIFGAQLLGSDISSWMGAPSNDATPMSRLFDVDWTDESYSLETAADGSLLVASTEPQHSIKRYTPSGTELGVFFNGETLSNEIYHIRRSTRGLYYLTDGQSKSQVLVLGPNGEFQGYVEPHTGYLAEARSLALPSGPYAAYCEVSEIPSLIMAGDDLNVTITIRDQDKNLWDNGVKISAVLSGRAIKGTKLYTLGQDLSDDVEHSDFGVYSFELQPRLASLTYPNASGDYLYDPQLIGYMEANGLTEVDPEEFKYQLTIAITSFGFVLRTQSYAVSAANTSALGTSLEDSHAVGFAGFEGHVVITAKDAYGNRKLEGGEASKFNVVVIDGREDTKFSSTLIDNRDGTYTLQYIAIITGTQLVEVRFNSQQIVHSPVAMAIAAGELNTTTSFLYADGVNFFDIGTDVVNFVFLQPRDSYNNLIPFRKSIQSANYTVEIDVPHNKFVAKVSNISYGLDGTFRSAYQVYLAPGESHRSLYEQDKMLERITITAAYNGIPLSTLTTVSPLVVPNHNQYRDEDYDHGLKVAGLCIVAIGMVIGSVYAVGVILLRNHQVFKFGNSGLLLLLCLGTVVVCSAPIVFGGEPQPTDAGCVGAFWMFHLGCSIVLSALLARTRRLSELMQGSRVLKPGFDRTRLVIVAPVAGTLLYMMLWTVTIPPRVEILVTKESTSVDGVVTKYQQETCSSGSVGWNYPIICIELLLLAYSMLLAYETRKMNRALLDGKQMSYVLYNFLFWAVVGFVLFLALQLQSSEPAGAFFVLCCTCFLCFVVSLNILLLPKFYKALGNRERRLTLSDFLKPRTEEEHPREDSTVEMQNPAATPTEKQGEAEGEPTAGPQYFL